MYRARGYVTERVAAGRDVRVIRPVHPVRAHTAEPAKDDPHIARDCATGRRHRAGHRAAAVPRERQRQRLVGNDLTRLADKAIVHTVEKRGLRVDGADWDAIEREQTVSIGPRISIERQIRADKNDRSIRDQVPGGIGDQPGDGARRRQLHIERQRDADVRERPRHRRVQAGHPILRRHCDGAGRDLEQHVVPLNRRGLDVMRNARVVHNDHTGIRHPCAIGEPHAAADDREGQRDVNGQLRAHRRDCSCHAHPDVRECAHFEPGSVQVLQPERVGAIRIRVGIPALASLRVVQHYIRALDRRLSIARKHVPGNRRGREGQDDVDLLRFAGRRERPRLIDTHRPVRRSGADDEALLAW